MKRNFCLPLFLFSFIACFSVQLLHAQVKWRVFHSAEGAFSVEIPQEPKYIYRLDSTEDAEGEAMSVKTQLYVAEGRYGSAYLVGYYSYPPGFIITEPKEALATMGTNIAAVMGGALAEVKETEYDGYPAAEFVIRMMSNAAYRGKFIIRSGRIYTVIAGASEQMLYNDEIERFFTSFRFKEFIYLPKKEYSYPEYGFSVKFPEKAVIDSIGNEVYTIQSLDTSSAVSYMAMVTPFNEYFEAKHADSVLGALYDIPQYMRQDTLLSVRKTTAGGFPAHEVEKMTKGTGQIYRFLYVLKENAVYSFFVFLPKNMLHSAPVNEFFTSVKFLPDTARYDIYSRKAGLILKDIASADTLRQQKSHAALRSYTFRQDELPQLYAALRASYPDDTLNYGSTRQMILQKFDDVNDSSTVPAITAIYRSYPAGASSLKKTTLQMLRSMNSQQSLEALADLLIKEELPSDIYDYAIYNKWNDTLNNYRYMFPKILEIFKKDTISSSFYTLLNIALDSNIVTAEAIKPHLGRLLHDIDQNLEIMQRDAATKDSIQSHYYEKANLLTTQAGILGKFTNDNAVHSRLEKLLKTDYLYLAISAVTALLQTGSNVEPGILKKLAADSSMRLHLYRSMDKIGSTDKFPQEYSSQQDISLSAMHEWLNEDETYSEKIEYAGEYEVSGGKTEGRYFLYKYMTHDEEGDEVWYAAISGPQPLDRKKISIEAKRTNSNWKKFEEMSPEEHFKTLLEDTLKWDEER